MCFAHEAAEHLLLLSRVRKLLFSRQKSNQKRRSRWNYLDMPQVSRAPDKLALFWIGTRAKELGSQPQFSEIFDSGGIVEHLIHTPSESAIAPNAV